MKKLKYAFSFFKRINLLSKFVKDPNVSRFKKIKIIGSLLFGFLYFLSPIDVVPEFFVGLGIIDDGVIILYILTIINEELDQYVQLNDKEYDNKILENIDYKIKDDN